MSSKSYLIYYATGSYPDEIEAYCNVDGNCSVAKVGLKEWKGIRVPAIILHLNNSSDPIPEHSKERIKKTVALLNRLLSQNIILGFQEPLFS
jgi:hypothetical protein